MRCLSIASCMKNAGIVCVFIAADENAKKIVSSNGFEVICLNSQWDDLDKETEQLVKVVQEYKIDKLLMDSYYVTKQYLERLMAYTQLIYIDDMSFFRNSVSMVINYNIYYEIFSYPEVYRGTDTQLLLGCNYAPLRDEFKSVKPSCREMVKKILITTGGTDPYNVAGKLLRMIIEDNLFKGIEFYVVVGKLNSYMDYLKELSEKSNSIILQQDVKNMSVLMSDCDIAITAGGSTMYELCACGVPAICFSFADNQLYGVKGFESAGLMAYAGDIRDSEEECISNLITNIEEYINNPKTRKDRSMNMRKKVDGKGASRIVKAVVDL